MVLHDFCGSHCPFRLDPEHQLHTPILGAGSYILQPAGMDTGVDLPIAGVPPPVAGKGIVTFFALTVPSRIQPNIFKGDAVGFQFIQPFFHLFAGQTAPKLTGHQSIPGSSGVGFVGEVIPDQATEFVMLVFCRGVPHHKGRGGAYCFSRQQIKVGFFQSADHTDAGFFFGKCRLPVTGPADSGDISGTAGSNVKKRHHALTGSSTGVGKFFGEFRSLVQIFMIKLIFCSTDLIVFPVKSSVHHSGHGDHAGISGHGAMTRPGRGGQFQGEQRVAVFDIRKNLRVLFTLIFKTQNPFRCVIGRYVPIFNPNRNTLLQFINSTIFGFKGI